MREQQTKTQVKRNNSYEIISTTCPPNQTMIYINQALPISHPHHFQVQMRQSNKCGKVTNDEIFNLHL